MGDYSLCKHDTAIGYCDICSPNWREDLSKADLWDSVYQKGIEKGLKMQPAKPMTPVEFCTWLEGFLHKSTDADSCLIKEKLKTVVVAPQMSPVYGPITTPPAQPVWITTPCITPPYTVGDDPTYKGPTC